MSFQKQLITRICDSGEWKEVRDKITPEHFTETDSQTVYRFLVRHALAHGAPPSRGIIRDRFPTFGFEPSADPPSALAERLHAAHVYNLIALNTEKLMKMAADDPIAAGELLTQQGSEMRTTLNRVTGNLGVDVTKQMNEERDAYRLRKERKGLTGWEWPWPILNRRTTGCERGSLTGLYARPKTGKTFYLLSLCEWFWDKYKARVHVFGREMRTEQLRSRLTATVAKIDYDRYTHGLLTTAEERAWWDATEYIEEKESFYIDGVDGNGAEAADEMFDKAMDSGADVIAVDGAYFFGDRDWELIAQFTSKFKKNLLHRCPMHGLMSSQAARAKKSGGDDVAYGDSLLQDVDMLIKVDIDPDDPTRTHMKTPGVRDGRPASWQAWRKMCTNFGQAFEEPDEHPTGGSGDAPPEVEA